MYKVSTPGSLMLLGEHAVLYHQRAIVAAINKRITVTIAPLASNKVEILSHLGHFVSDLADLKIQAPFQFVLAACIYFKNKLKGGIVIQIESEFSDKVGFGSSAAVTVAVVSAIKLWIEGVPSAQEDIFYLAKEIMMSVQGVGSGSDIAASVYGGISLYHQSPFRIEKANLKCPLVVIYSGYKTPTKEVIQIVSDRVAQNPARYGEILRHIDNIVVESWPEIKKENWQKVAKFFHMQQELMQALGVSTKKLEEIIEILCHQPGVKGAKISGSGLGDCIIALGQMNTPFPLDQMTDPAGVQELLVEVSNEGLSYHA